MTMLPTNGPENDPEHGPVAPRPGATLMLLRDADPGLEVLLLRRSDRARFVPGAHVFPGGAVDDADHDTAYRLHATTPADDLAHRVAAIRESLEEAGILLATTADGAALDRAHPVLTELPALRHRIEAGHDHLAGVCRTHDLRLAIDDVVPVDRWVTPEESPVRFDARFYVAPTPPGQTAVADDREVGDARWWNPSHALDAWRARRIQLIEPTVASLRLLADHVAVDDALGHLRDRPVPVRS
ncbi:MAG: NUDIX domain-containing protein [Acidimicrobiales bacterium]|nr:NUDIX domain-containing protein [Acidimicrobiales bacterium]